MVYFHRILFCLLFISNSLFAIESKVKDCEIPPLTPHCLPDTVEKDQNSLKKELGKQTQQSELLTEDDIAEMEMVFKAAPIEAQIIVKHLKDPMYIPINNDYRYAIFFGEPGSGKTTTAKAIGHKMSKKGWNYKIISSAKFLGENRNQTAIYLQKELEAIVASGKPTIIIIDELNNLLENADSKHHDTDTTSSALWTFLDSQHNNKNFFLIGTMNRISKLPKPFKDRIIFESIEFSLTNNAKAQSFLLRKLLTTNRTQLDKEITDDFLNNELKKMGACGGRNIKNMATAICAINRINDDSNVFPLIIKKESIAKAISRYSEFKEKSQYNKIEETDEEREERHHKENIALQEKHFVQQHLVQPLMAKYQKAIIDYGEERHYTTTIKTSIESILSDEQKNIYYDSMKNTNNRKEKETEQKLAKEKEDAEEAAKNSLINRSRRYFNGE
jgi:AAA+ superfamily predicted ATPase